MYNISQLNKKTNSRDFFVQKSFKSFEFFEEKNAKDGKFVKFIIDIFFMEFN